MITDAFRASVLATYGASPSETEELLAYNHNTFDHTSLTLPMVFPLASEAHVEAWDHYEEDARTIGAFEALKKRLVQFSFPIQEGLSQSEGYLAATRRGVPVDVILEATGLSLQKPEYLQLLIHQSPAGRTPVILPGCREDFVALVQALSKRNEAALVPASMGACMVGGYNNWDRVRTLRQAWEAAHPDDPDSWAAEFKRIIPQRELYQDRFMIVSDGPYSNVFATDLGLHDDEWRHLSFTIRVAHECTHYFTRRVFGAMRNNAIDELIADYVGIVAAVGQFRVDWFFRFMGLETFPAYREGGRLQNYRGTPPLSDGAFTILQRLVKDAAEHLAQFDMTYAETLRDDAEVGSILVALTSLTLEELASQEAEARLTQAWNAVRTHGPSSA